MNIYFFSEHAPAPQMIKDIDVPITTQFKGEISNIQILNNLISFTETLFIGGQRIKAPRTIPGESIVIVQGSLLLQDAWLAAGVLTLLVPQMKQEQEASVKGRSQYCGLVQVHKIVVITSPWSYCTVTHS
ncbi:MAG: hypothetical protein PUP91_27970 [Rhizonema sp. PD37]|nr:hypothetical protein [Rhizonema sp. PD37]